MKLCSSLLLSVGVTAQYADDASDRWGGTYNYVDAFNYGGKNLRRAGMHFDTFSLYFSTLRADISAPVNPRGLKSTLLKSEKPSDSKEVYFNPSTLEG